MDIKKKIEEIASSVKNDGNLLEKFKKDPAGTIKNLLGVPLPDDQLNALVSGVKAKITAGGVSDALGKAKGLFGK
ncbi:MAG: hypothetical protein ACOYJD_00315 [Christensenellales bacterium]|jgi:hypothetical protein